MDCSIKFGFVVGNQFVDYFVYFFVFECFFRVFKCEIDSVGFFFGVELFFVFVYVKKVDIFNEFFVYFMGNCYNIIKFYRIINNQG